MPVRTGAPPEDELLDEEELELDDEELEDDDEELELDDELLDEDEELELLDEEPPPQLPITSVSSLKPLPTPAEAFAIHGTLAAASTV